MGALTSGAVIASCKFSADYGLRGGVFTANPTIHDILAASAGLGLAAGLSSDSAGDAALRGLQFGGVATAAYVLTDGQPGVLSQKFNKTLSYISENIETLRGRLFSSQSSYYVNV